MEVFSPRGLDEALRFKADHPEAVPVAGGTDLMVELNAGRAHPAALLDLSQVDELKVSRQNGSVFLGAGVTFARITRELPGFAPLVEAARSVGSVQIRNRATIGGNLATASPAGDSLPVLAAYGADVLAGSAHGTRRIPLEAFLVGPKRTALAPDELILGVEWLPVTGAGSFTKIGRRNALVIAIASACVQLDGAGRRIRLALGSVAPTVLRAHGAEAFAADAIDWDDPDPAALDEFGCLAAAACSPIDDRRGSAAYRRYAVGVLARRALITALEEPC